MKNILLINPSLILNENFIDYPYFINLGMLQNAACLKENGYKVTIFDSFAQINSEFYQLKNSEFMLGCPIGTLISFLKKNQFNIIIIGINSFLHPHRYNNNLKDLVKKVKIIYKKSILIACDFYFSGMHYINYESTQFLKLYPEFDYLIKYETEKVLLEVVEKLPEAKSIFGKGKDIVLNSLPYPAWDLINTNNYFNFLRKVFFKTKRNYLFKIQDNILPIITTRGCVYNCVFCSTNPDEKNNHRTYRTYSTDYLRKYIRYLKDKYQISVLVILDGMVNLKKIHFNNLITVLNEEKLFYDFPNGFRADKLDKKQLIKLKGKVQTLSISAESGNQDIINKIIKKNQDLSKIEKVAKWCSELKIPLIVHYIIGLPGEKKKDINTTLQYAYDLYKNYHALPSLQFAVPLPGTKLYDIFNNDIKDKKVNNYSDYFSKKTFFNKNELKNFKKVFDLKIQSKELEKIIINITYKCNNHCIFCAISDRNKIELSYEEIRKLLLEYRNKNIKLLDLDGGEPTLHKDLFNIIKFGKNIGYEKINVTTNGRRLMYVDYAKKLLNSGITDLLISLHSHNDNIQELNTGVKESFSQTISGIENVTKLNNGKINIGVNFTITKYNYKYLMNFFNFVIKLGIKKISIQFITPFGRAQKSILPPRKKSINIIKNCLDRFKEKIQVNIINIPFCYFKEYEGNVVEDFYKHKRYMKFADGDIVNLGEFLKDKRRKKRICFNCVYYIICDGFYEF